jgi:hypothetical protein
MFFSYKMVQFTVQVQKRIVVLAPVAINNILSTSTELFILKLRCFGAR